VLLLHKLLNIVFDDASRFAQGCPVDSFSFFVVASCFSLIVGDLINEIYIVFCLDVDALAFLGIAVHLPFLDFTL
jgi:hypothetical protein